MVNHGQWTGLTKGNAIGRRTEEMRLCCKDDPTGKCAYHRANKITAEMIDDWGEEQWEAMTVGAWKGMPTCSKCHVMISAQGACACGVMTPEERALFLVFGIVPPEREGVSVTNNVEDDVVERERPSWVPTSAEAELPPEDASPEELAQWRENYRRMREFREVQLRGTYVESTVDGSKVYSTIRDISSS